jgi:hypothetical protein
MSDYWPVYSSLTVNRIRAQKARYAPDPRGYLVITVRPKGRANWNVDWPSFSAEDQARMRSEKEAEQNGWIDVAVYRNKKYGDNGSARLHELFRGDCWWPLLRALTTFGDDSFGDHSHRRDHILYAAQQLLNAEEALDTGRVFVQDKPLQPIADGWNWVGNGVMTKVYEPSHKETP